MDNPRGWLEELQKTPNAEGIVYTTWQNKYALARGVCETREWEAVNRRQSTYPGVNGHKNWNLDSTLTKTFPIKERLDMEFRFEMYNSPNGFVWADPNMTVTSSLFGRSTNQVNRGRECQYSLRLLF